MLNGFLRKKNMDVYDGSKEEAFDDYMGYGGLPAVTLMGTEEQKTNYLITQVNNLYLRDIINRYHLQSDTAIGELLDVISSGISTLTNPRKLSATFATVKQTSISEITVDKDIRLRNARLNFRQIEGTHIMENIIYNDLRFRGYKVDVGVVESREKDDFGKEIRKQLEIDFIATLGSKKYYIQSVYAIPDEEKYKQETKSFDKANDSFKKIIPVEKSMKPRRDDNGYVCMGVKEFLLDAGSLEV